MKNQLISLTILASIFFSCQDEGGQGEPLLWYFYAQVETGDGKDYFNTYSDYDFEKFKICTEHNIESSCPMIIDFPEAISTVNDYHVFRIGKTSETQGLLDFGNGDIDTLTYRWKPENIFPNETLSNVEYIDVYYNGSKIYRFDFENNAPSRLNLLQQNSDPQKSNLIIVPIVKESPDGKGS